MPENLFPAETNAERRRYARLPINLRVEYKCLDRGYVSEPAVNLAEDLGAGGLALHTREKLDTGQILMVMLFLPPLEKRQHPGQDTEYDEEESVVVEVLSRVAWSSIAKPDGFMAGIQFLDLDQHNRKWLKDFLVDYALDRPDSNLYI